MSLPQFAANHHPGGDPLNMGKPALPTDAQITRVLVPMIGERRWQTAAQLKGVARLAILNIVITWALHPMSDATPPAVSRVINDTVGRASTYGERVNAILAHLAARITDESLVYLYAPLTRSGSTALIEWLQTMPRVTTKES